MINTEIKDSKHLINLIKKYKLIDGIRFAISRMKLKNFFQYTISKKI